MKYKIVIQCDIEEFETFDNVLRHELREGCLMIYYGKLNNSQADNVMIIPTINFLSAWTEDMD